MSEITISSTNWLAISLRNGAAMIFNLSDTQQWQYLQSNEVIPTAKTTTTDDDEENSNDLNRNLIKFSPNGEKLAINGQNKQIYIYVPSNETQTKIYWQLQRVITVIKRASALDLTNEYLLIADKSGDVYKTDFFVETNLVLTPEDCLMGHLSMLLDIAFVRTQENDEYLLTADRDEKIRLSRYPNAYNIQGYCLGHAEFVSHVKLINSNHILSASGDGEYLNCLSLSYSLFRLGTVRLWHLPDCVEVNCFPMKTLLSSSREIFYDSVSDSIENESSPIDDSIWKLATTTSPDVFIALSIYAHRNHSIYLTTLENFSHNQRKLTFDSKYGSIIDYCFPSQNNASDLYILFDSNRLIRVNIPSILSCEKKEYLEKTDSTIDGILANQDFHLVNAIQSNEIIFKQLFKNRTSPGDSSYYKRKTERLEQQEEKRRKKQCPTAS